MNQKFKVALNPAYRIFIDCQKLVLIMLILPDVTSSHFRFGLFVDWAAWWITYERQSGSPASAECGVQSSFGKPCSLRPRPQVSSRTHRIRGLIDLSIMWNWFYTFVANNKMPLFDRLFLFIHYSILEIYYMSTWWVENERWEEGCILRCNF